MTQPPSAAQPGDAPPAALPTARKKRSFMDVVRALGRPRVAVMLALGVSSGLPFLMIGNTLGYWLREGGTALAAIGFLSWAGLAYAFKFIWGALVDRAPPPFLGFLGRRRGWMIWCQVGVAIGLVGMALSGPHPGMAAQVALLGWASVLTGVSAAAQDTVIDAWRIEIAEDADELGLLTSAYSIGFRIAIIATDAWILWLSTLIGWAWSYAVFAGIMGVGVGAALLAKEPVGADSAIAAKAQRAAVYTPRGLYDLLLEPFVSFFRAQGWAALLILSMITLYHLCDYLRGPILNPYYVDLGIPKSQVAAIRTTVGLGASITGVIVGGLFSVRFGYMRALIAGGILQPLAILGFAFLTYWRHDPGFFTAVMIFDGFSMSFAGVALIAYMSTLTSLGYTATQYALLTSALAWTGKFLKGFSGAWVQSLATGGRDLLHAYALFYVIAAGVGAPALALVLWLAVVEPGRLARRARMTGTAVA
jgi:PAT family beta-lactamase induction signal transducer AmpG